MNPRNAAHLCDVAAAGPFDCPVMLASEFDAAVEAAICAMFLANRSLSPKSIFSRRFMAPGRLFMLFRRMIFTWSLASAPAVLLPCPGVSSSGSAPASESSVATSFLFGRRRLALLDEGLVILDINAACLICRLSLLVDGKSDEPKVEDFTRCDEDEDFFRADFSCLGALCIGA